MRLHCTRIMCTRARFVWFSSDGYSACHTWKGIRTSPYIGVLLVVVTLLLFYYHPGCFTSKERWMSPVISIHVALYVLYGVFLLPCVRELIPSPTPEVTQVHIVNATHRIRSYTIRGTSRPLTIRTYLISSRIRTQTYNTRRTANILKI
jgi:hypothetical protein